MEKTPVISTVIPLYNKAEHIEKTLETVFAQTYGDYEIVIVDDGSTDTSAERVERINDPRIRLIRQRNAGVAAARNRGISEARGEFVALLDADDDWKPEYLAEQMRLARKYPDCDVFATDYEFRDQNGKVSRTIIRKLPFEGEDGTVSNYFEVASSGHPPLWTSAVMARKSAFEGVGGFPAGIRSGEDLLTWARLACRHRIAYSRKPLAVFNVEGYDVREKPKRVPAEDDIVGRELAALKREFNPAHIDRYLSHWHKMRSSVYMRLGMRGKSIREALKGLRHNPANFKLAAFIALNLLPKRLQFFR